MVSWLLSRPMIISERDRKFPEQPMIYFAKEETGLADSFGSV